MRSRARAIYLPYVLLRTVAWLLIIILTASILTLAWSFSCGLFGQRLGTVLPNACTVWGADTVKGSVDQLGFNDLKQQLREAAKGTANGDLGKWAINAGKTLDRIAEQLDRHKAVLEAREQQISNDERNTKTIEMVAVAIALLTLLAAVGLERQIKFMAEVAVLETELQHFRALALALEDAAQEVYENLKRNHPNTLLGGSNIVLGLRPYLAAMQSRDIGTLMYAWEKLADYFGKGNSGDYPKLQNYLRLCREGLPKSAACWTDLFDEEHYSERQRIQDHK